MTIGVSTVTKLDGWCPFDAYLKFNVDGGKPKSNRNCWCASYFERGLFSCLYKVVGVKHSNEAEISVIQEALRIFYHFS